MRQSLKLIDPAFLSLLAYIVEDKLEVLAWRSKANLVLSAIEFIIQYLRNALVDKDITIYDVEHALDFVELTNRVDETQRVKVVNAADLLYDKTPFNQLADLLWHLERFGDVLRKEVKHVFRGRVHCFFGRRLFFCWFNAVLLFFRTSCGSAGKKVL